MADLGHTYPHIECLESMLAGMFNAGNLKGVGGKKKEKKEKKLLSLVLLLDHNEDAEYPSHGSRYHLILHKVDILRSTSP